MSVRVFHLLLAALALSACHSTRSVDGAATPAPKTFTLNDPATPTAAVKPTAVGTNPGHAGAGTSLTPSPGHALAAFSEGCFWGSEETFRRVTGVTATAVGYTGGHTTNPTYDSVCTHTTGHAETVLVEFDPNQVSYAALLDTFWRSHDPTQGNKQGPDVGDQYRSAIWTFDDAQNGAARLSMADEQLKLDRPITTEVRRIGAFWMAEDYHQQYDEKAGKPSCGTGFGAPTF